MWWFIVYAVSAYLMYLVMFKTYYCTRIYRGSYKAVERVKKPVWLWMLSAILFLIPVANLAFSIFAIFLIYQDAFTDYGYNETRYVRIKESKFLNFFTQKI